MNKKRNLILVFALLFVTVLTGSIVANTFAKYISRIDGGVATTSVAKWAFEEDNASTNFVLSLDKTYNSDTLVAGKIAPGTSGKFTLDLSNENTEVGTEYVVAFSVENVPTNLKLYSDQLFADELVDSELTGTLAPGETDQVTIYWNWEYETASGDEQDTTDGETITSLDIPVTITGTQVEPQ